MFTVSVRVIIIKCKYVLSMNIPVDMEYFLLTRVATLMLFVWDKMTWKSRFKLYIEHLFLVAGVGWIRCWCVGGFRGACSGMMCGRFDYFTYLSFIEIAGLRRKDF